MEKKMLDKTLSIVMPVYNEEECIDAVVKDIVSEILDKLPGARLLAIDDGSLDSTPEKLDKLQNDYEQVIVFHKPNGGHGSALIYGINKTEGDYIFLMDSDRQFVVRDFWKLWANKSEHLVLAGTREKRHDPTHRLILTKFVSLGIRFFFGVYLKDSNIPFKLMSKKFIDYTMPTISKDTLTPSIFFALMAAKHNDYKYVAYPVTHLPRKTGTCSIKYVKLFKFCCKAFKQLLDYRDVLVKCEENCHILEG